MHRFEGKQVVVTGGAGALGSAVVERLAREGAAVIVPIEGDAKAGALHEMERVRTVEGVDLGEADACERFFAEAAGDGALWGSVHVAGGFAMGGIEGDDAPGQFAQMMRLNAQTCYLSCRSALRRMGDGGGRIVNVAARPALRPEQGGQMVAYAASKAAVAAMTGALAAEVKGRGVLVNAVAPSTIDTPANREAMPDADHAAWPTPEAIAETICFLACPSNTLTSGEVVPVYGKV